MEKMNEDVSGLMNPRNTATFSLDGTHEEVQHNHLNFIGYFRHWCYVNGYRKDVSHLFDRQCIIYSTPLRATFYPVVTYEGQSLIFQADGRNLYLKGFTGPKGSFQFCLDEQKAFYMLQRLCKMMDFGSNYHTLIGDVGLTPTGLHWLRSAFLTLCAYLGPGGRRGQNQLWPTPRVSFSIFAVHLCEPVRFQIVLDAISFSLTNDSMSRLDKMAKLSLWVTNWSSFSKQIISYINKLLKGEIPDPINNHQIESIETIEDLMREVRVLFVDADTVGLFAEPKPLTGPVFASPVDPGIGDKDVHTRLFESPDLHVHNKHTHKRLGIKGKEKTKKRGKDMVTLLDAEEVARRKFYLSGGVGGPTHGFARFLIDPLIIRLKRPVRVPSSTPKSFAPFTRGQKMQLSSGTGEALDKRQFQLAARSETREVLKPLDRKVAVRANEVDRTSLQRNGLMIVLDGVDQQKKVTVLQACELPVDLNAFRFQKGREEEVKGASCLYPTGPKVYLSDGNLRRQKKKTNSMVEDEMLEKDVGLKLDIPRSKLSAKSMDRRAVLQACELPVDLNAFRFQKGREEEVKGASCLYSTGPKVYLSDGNLRRQKKKTNSMVEDEMLEKDVGLKLDIPRSKLSAKSMDRRAAERMREMKMTAIWQPYGLTSCLDSETKEANSACAMSVDPYAVRLWKESEKKSTLCSGPTGLKFCLKDDNPWRQKRKTSSLLDALQTKSSYSTPKLDIRRTKERKKTEMITKSTSTRVERLGSCTKSNNPCSWDITPKCAKQAIEPISVQIQCLMRKAAQPSNRIVIWGMIRRVRG